MFYLLIYSGLRSLLLCKNFTERKANDRKRKESAIKCYLGAKGQICSDAMFHSLTVMSNINDI